MPGLKAKTRKRKRNSFDDKKVATETSDQEVTFNNNVKRPRLEAPTPPQPPPRRSPNGFILPDPLPVGLVICDLRGSRWTIGKSVGLGGFGEIYSATGGDEPGEFVIKVEPHSNGPLFVEVNFYLRAAKQQTINDYKEQFGASHLGVPHVQGTGSFSFQGKKYRFLVIPRFGTDLQTLLDESKLTLSTGTACHIASQVVDSYQYIHSKGYVHKDVKGSNLLFESKRSSLSCNGRKVYLVDYGLVSKYLQMGVHKPYAYDARSAHEGTLEYASRDAHMGCVSRRGDIEVLLYNIIDWIGGTLPWDKPTFVKPTAIQEAKTRAFQDCREFLTQSLGSNFPQFILNLMEYVNALHFEEEPDYDYIRALLEDGKKTEQPGNISANNSADEVTLSITVRPSSKSRVNDVITAPTQDVRRRGKRGLRRSKDTSSKDVAVEEEITERIIQKQSAARFAKESGDVVCQMMATSMLNPTPMMLEQLRKIKQRNVMGKGTTPKPEKRRRSVSISRASMAERQLINNSTTTKKPERLKLTRKTSSSKKLRPIKSESAIKASLPSQNRRMSSIEARGNNLRRSPRILDPINVNIQEEKRASFRQNISEFFANVTRSILRISQN